MLERQASGFAALAPLLVRVRTLGHFVRTYIGFRLLWVPACYFRSTAAIGIAPLGHLCIRFHYFCTEFPDMERIHAAASRS